MKKQLRAALLGFAIASTSLATGCAFEIHAMNPRPNVNLPTSNQTLALRIGSSIPDTFVTPTANNVWGGRFDGFHTSLERGFRGAFGESFKTAELESADLILAIAELEPTFVPTAVAVNGYGAVMGPAAATAELRYKVNLLDRRGSVLGRASGTIRGKRSFLDRGGAQYSVQSALEELFEKVAQELLANGAARAPLASSSH